MTITVEHRDGRTWGTWFVQRTASLLTPDFICTGGDRLAGIKPVDGSPKLTPPKVKGCVTEEKMAGNLNVYTIRRADSDPKPAKKHIYYFPGGACIAQASPLHWLFCAALVREIPDCSATIISYPLTPKNSAPSCYNDIQAACQILLKQAQELGEVAIFAGDSAGGNLALGVPLASLKSDAAALAPRAIILLSPSVDVRLSNPRCAAVEKLDPIMTLEFCNRTIKAWAGDWSLSDPRLTPIEADFTPFVQRGIRLYGVLAKWDVLCPDGELLIAKLKDSLSGRFLVWDKQMHDFPLMSALGLYEAKSAVNWIIQAAQEV